MNKDLRAIGLIVLLAATTALADDVATRHTLTLDGARKAGDAATAYATAKGAPGGAMALGSAPLFERARN